MRRLARICLASCLITLASAATVAADEGLTLVEPEAFNQLGGWVVDQQFMDVMGSPYVLAHGLGVPVDDCAGRVRLPSAGSYHVWVRTRDWVAPWNAPGAPGRFEVRIDNRSIGTFGTEGAEWRWHDGGVHELDADFELRLHDLTGFEGRCDAVLFAKDQDWRPPHGGEELAELRGAQLGWDRGPEDGGEYDLVVVGGGIAGTSAAIAAARLGLSVALVQDRPVLGGNGSSEVRVWPEGFSNHEPYPRVGDVVIEMLGEHRWAKELPDVKAHQEFNDRHKLELAQAEPNLTLMLEQRVNAASARDGAIRSVVAQHTRTGRRTRVTARWFLDSTGDGVLGELVGADYELSPDGRMGSTNLWSFGETEENEHALECLCEDFDERVSLNFTPATTPQPFPRCPWAADLTDVDFPGRDRQQTFGLKGDNQLGTWFWESGFNRDPIADGEWIRDLNLRAMYGAWDVLKNVDKRYPNHRLKWSAFVMGKRESRRLMGDVVLTADDFRKGTPFEDAAFPCTWHIDVHSPHPDYFDNDDTDAFFSTYTRGKEYQYKGPYWAPYRCLYSRNISNLFMAGRDISVTQGGLGAVRVMRTCGMMGEVVAMAASVCKEHDCDPRAVYESHLDDLKRLLEQGVGKDSPAVRRASDRQTRAYNFRDLIQPAPASGRFTEEDYYVWGGSMVRCDDGLVHLLYSRWPRELGHDAWVTHSEIAHAVADSPFGEMRHVGVALPARGREHWDGMCTHNPNVHRFGDKYYLYYMGNTGDRAQPDATLNAKELYWQHRNNQRIGVAVADTPAGPWRRFEEPLITSEPDFYDAQCCANPSVTRRPDGGYLMVYKAIDDQRRQPFGGPVVHIVATSDSPTGPFKKHPTPIFTKESVAFPAEDPYIWADGERYYAILKDMQGHFTGAGKSTALFVSDDGFDWRPAADTLVATTKLPWASGREQPLYSLERPQVFFEAGKPTALLFAADTDKRREHAFNIRIPLGRSATGPATAPAQ